MAEIGIRTVPLVCGQCGFRMTAKQDQVVYRCDGCGMTWELAGGSLVSKTIVHLGGTGEVRLPFWMAAFKVQTKSGEVDDQAGFMAMSGVVGLAGAASESPLCLYVPAFPLPPKQAVRLGRNMTVRFPRFREAVRQDLTFEPVTIREADVPVFAELIVLAAVVEDRRSNPNFLAAFRVRIPEVHLVTIPFVRQGNRLCQAELNLEV